jgi:hypothetical protein
MTKREILDLEKKNKDKIYLHKEGTFWIAYERSAHRFVEGIRAYKVTKKHIKVIGTEITSIGFPESALSNLAIEIVDRTDKLITLKAPVKKNERKFEKWKSEVKQSEPPKETAPPGVSLEERLRNFDLENKTPLDCMAFLVELKRHSNDALRPTTGIQRGIRPEPPNS